MSSAFDNGIPNLQSSDATRNKSRKTIFNNLRKENEHPTPTIVGKYQPVRVCSKDGCVVSTPSYQSKMDVNFGWLLCETPWCNYNLTNPANSSAAGKYLELNTSEVEQSVVDTDATSGAFTGEIYSVYNVKPDSSEVIMDLGSADTLVLYKPADLHLDPDGKLFSGQQIKTASNMKQNVKYCGKNSTSWKNYVAPQSRYTTYASPNPYQLIASQNTSRVPTNVTYGTKYSIFKTNGSKNENNPVKPCLCHYDDGEDTTGPTMIISSSTLSSGASTNDDVVALIFTSSKVTTDFEVGDITVTNGVISDFAGSGTDYTATFTTIADGVCSVVVNADTFFDALDTPNTVSNTFAWTYDTVPPEMTITSSTVSSGATTNDTVVALIFTSSKVTTDFASGDITVSNGVISDFAGSGTGYTATFNTTADGACSAVVNAGTFTGPAGNLNIVSNTYTWTLDTVGPTMTISSSTVIHGATTDIIFIALILTSSKVTTDFASGDITPINGSITAFGGSGTGYTATFTTTTEGACSVVVNAGTFTGPIGNLNTVSNTFAWTYDDPAGSVALYVDDTSGNPNTAYVAPPPDGFTIPIGRYGWGDSMSTGYQPTPPSGGGDAVLPLSTYLGPPQLPLYIGHLTNTASVLTAVFNGYDMVGDPLPGYFQIEDDGSGNIRVSHTDTFQQDTIAIIDWGVPLASSGHPTIPDGTAMIPWEGFYYFDPFGGGFLWLEQYQIWFVNPDGTVTQAPDNPPAAIIDMTVAGDNLTVTVTFNIAAFTADDGTGSLVTTDFALSKVGGTAILGSTPITCTEDTPVIYTLGLSLSGTIDGNEVITVNPASGTSIYSAASTPADPRPCAAIQGNNYNSLHAPPIIISTVLAAGSTLYVQSIEVEFNEDVFNQPSGLTPVQASDFFLHITGGVATLQSPTPASMSTSDNTTFTLELDFDTSFPPPIGTEKVHVRPESATSIYNDTTGTPASTTQSNNFADLAI